MRLILEENTKMKECMETLIHSINKKEEVVIKKDDFFSYPVVPFNTVEQLKTFNDQLLNKTYMDQMVLLSLNINYLICKQKKFKNFRLSGFINTKQWLLTKQSKTFSSTCLHMTF